MGFISSIKSRLRGYSTAGSKLPNPRLVMPKAPKSKKGKKTPQPQKAKSKPKDRFADTVPLLRNKTPEPMKTRSKMMIPAGRKSGGIIPTATKPRRDLL
jgi:hypothetical protein